MIANWQQSDTLLKKALSRVAMVLKCGVSAFSRVRPRPLGTKITLCKKKTG